MKISKLFHWLYAFVMFLPIFAIGSTLLISTFNMSAKQETEIQYKYKTNEVNSNADLIIGNAYVFTTQDFYIESTVNDFDFNFFTIKESNFDSNENILNESYYNDIEHLNDNIYGNLQGSLNGVGSIYFYYGNDSYTYYDIDQQSLNLIAYIVINSLGVMNQNFYKSFSALPLNDNVILSVETHNLDTQEVFYNAVDKVTESPLFSWSYNSFLVAPFSYIVALFSIPTNHVIVELLSYWLAISIIWLVFDLVMYVPLLVHRWLDKGVLE